MSKRPGFAMIREGLLDHMTKMAPMESKLYLIHHLMARRTGPDKGKVLTNLSRLSAKSGHKWEHVKRAVEGLVEKKYLEPIEGGWLITNYNGDSPVLSQKGIVTPKGDTPKRDRTLSQKGIKTIPKRDTPLSRKGIPNPHKPNKNKPVNPSVYVKETETLKDRNKRTAPGGAAAWKATGVSWDEFRAGVSWSNELQEVGLTEPARKGLMGHLKVVAAEENLSVPTKAQLQESWGRLSTHLIPESRKRGPACLPGLVRNWFVNDMRRCGRGPGGKLTTQQRNFEVIKQFMEDNPDGDDKGI